MNFEFQTGIDVGHFLTALTLAVALLSWIVKTILSWWNKQTKDAKNGALRLLLKLLRKQKEPIGLQELFALYQHQDRKADRKAYCGRNWRFKNPTQFEAAIYQLDWEGKIDFTSPDHIVFRVDHHGAAARATSRFAPDEEDKKIMLQTLKNGLDDNELESFELRGLIESCARADREETSTLIRNGLRDADETKRRRIVAAVSSILPEVLS